MAESIRSGDIEISPAQDGRPLVHSRTTGARAHLDAEQVELLLYCSRFRPLAEQAEEFARLLDLRRLHHVTAKWPRWLRRFLELAKDPHKPSSASIARQRTALEGLLAMGFLGTAASFREQCQSHRGQGTPAPIRTVGITSRNRPEALQRGISSYLDNAREFSRPLEIVLIDDSLDAAGETACRTLLAGLSRDRDAPIRFAGRSDRRLFAAALAQQADVDPSLTEFALLGDERCPVTTGSARNSLLLDQVGQAYLLADDDGVCRVAPRPDRSEGLALSSRPDPTNFWFYPSRAEMLAQARFESQDLAALHERLLGRSVGDLLVPTPDQRLDLSELSPAFERRLRTTPVRVRATMAGVLGDSGIGSTAYLSVYPDSARRLTVTEDFYRCAVASRQVLRAAGCWTVGDSKTCMAGNLGIDHTALLPPFSPVQRNSDGLFARLLQRCFYDAAMGYLPYAVLHDPLSQRRHSVDDWFKDIRRTRFSWLVIALLRAWPGQTEPHESPGRALASLGKFFENAAAGSLDDLIERIRLQLLDQAAAGLHAPGRHQDPGLPAFYRDLRTKRAKVEREAMASPQYLTPRDLLVDGRDEDSARLLAQQLILRFGRLLQAWPEIQAAAVRLRLRGERLTQPV